MANATTCAIASAFVAHDNYDGDDSGGGAWHRRHAFRAFIAKRFGFVRLENSGVFVCFFLSVCFCIVHGFLRNKKVGRTLENAKVNAFDVGFGWVYNLCVRSNNAIWNTKFGGECS